ncbi:glycosyltransferase [Thiocapsa rosea]|uniref:Glycosyltransferase involved in cell wall biosynthesis n=1 Tax=Thiocapsa rosea TaxID=69360 RepID=A0A495VDK7_9GAMM|nr:glycosyltransferase [Thiocapsa rosea]RKT47476.1 glycosyltransferase involved in cell wall biosynthesis [Thiocapsa rosea]
MITRSISHSSRLAVQRLFRALGIIRARDQHRRSVSLAPRNNPRGRVLLSYIIDPFLLRPGEEIANGHTHHWESAEIGRLFLERDYAIDVISYRNTSFMPNRTYDVFVSARTNLQQIAERLNSNCIKVAHLDTAHWIENNRAAYGRLNDLKHRRGIVLHDPKLFEQSWAIEHADIATALGNEYTIATYRYAKKPIYRIPISTPAIYDWPVTKSFSNCRLNFIWFGSAGFVHKGLDLVLEAFAGLPKHKLTVFGPLESEPDFCRAFHRELYETENIHAYGWIDVESASFRDQMNNAISLVYPSCAEGGGGSVLSCMHAGVIPILTPSSSVDLNGSGIELDQCNVDAIRAAVEDLSAKPEEELRALSLATWKQARAYHTRERFSDTYGLFIDTVLAPMIAERSNLNRVRTDQVT